MESSTIPSASWAKEKPHTKAIFFPLDKTHGLTRYAREKGKEGTLVKDKRALGIWRLKKMIEGLHQEGKLKSPLGAIIYDLASGRELYRFKNGSWV